MKLSAFAGIALLLVACVGLTLHYVDKEVKGREAEGKWDGSQWNGREMIEKSVGGDEEESTSPREIERQDEEEIVRHEEQDGLEERQDKKEFKGYVDEQSVCQDLEVFIGRDDGEKDIGVRQEGVLLREEEDLRRHDEDESDRYDVDGSNHQVEEDGIRDKKEVARHDVQESVRHDEKEPDHHYVKENIRHVEEDKVDRQAGGIDRHEAQEYVRHGAEDVDLHDRGDIDQRDGADQDLPGNFITEDLESSVTNKDRPPIVLDAPQVLKESIRPTEKTDMDGDDAPDQLGSNVDRADSENDRDAEMNTTAAQSFANDDGSTDGMTAFNRNADVDTGDLARDEDEDEVESSGVGGKVESGMEVNQPPINEGASIDYETIWNNVGSIVKRHDESVVSSMTTLSETEIAHYVDRLLELTNQAAPIFMASKSPSTAQAAHQLRATVIRKFIDWLVVEPGLDIKSQRLSAILHDKRINIKIVLLIVNLSPPTKSISKSHLIFLKSRHFN